MIDLRSLDLSSRFARSRQASVDLCSPLARDDFQVQSAEFVSPPKWHLAHTTWFLETFILQRLAPDYRSINPIYAQLFNSYYESLGHPHSRPSRGHLSRPVLEDVMVYRHDVDDKVQALLAKHPSAELSRMMMLGINHEEQHQELLYMDIKHILYMNPMRPVFWHDRPPAHATAVYEQPQAWLGIDAGDHRIGSAGDSFAFDNEGPKHQVHVGAVAIADRPVTNGEYLDFITSGGYDEPLLWLSDGWTVARAEGWQAPLYWDKRPDGWWHFTLQGMQPVDLHAAVCHVSYYEALAYAHWRGARLPSEYEWEVAAKTTGLRYGEVWEWTQSAYGAYPGFRVSRDALGEYNGKFMVNQMVLRGGAAVTPTGHVRPTYRNFYHPHMRWQYAGLRLLEDR